jgi:hypothetical protein
MTHHDPHDAKRNPTKHTEERSGSAAGPGSKDLPEGAEHAEYTGYDRQDSGASKSGPDSEGDPGEAEARREASLQPGGEVDGEREKDADTDKARSGD